MTIESLINIVYRFSQSSLEKKAIPRVMAFLLLFCSVIALPISVAAKQQSESRKIRQIYLTVESDSGLPSEIAQTTFGCTDKIYTIVELEKYKLGKHEIGFQWTDPAGKTRENTRYPFYVNKDQDLTKLWSWLSLSRGAGAGMMQWLNPAAGLEEFVGPWTVEILINGKRIAKKDFEINC